MRINHLIKASIEAEAESQRMEFYSLGNRGHYGKAQKSYAIGKAQEIGVRATARLLKLPRRTIQRWLREKGIEVKRCPDWVYEWAYWRRKGREKWERIKYYIKWRHLKRAKRSDKLTLKKRTGPLLLIQLKNNKPFLVLKTQKKHKARNNKNTFK